VVAFYGRAEASFWMPQQTGLTGDGMALATTSACPRALWLGCSSAAVCGFGQGLAHEE
jgi:hypothetical protein